MSMPALAGSCSQEEGAVFTTVRVPQCSNNSLLSHQISFVLREEREMLLFFSKKHTTNALGHDLSLLFSARSPTLKT